MEDEMISAFFQANDIDNMEVHEPIVITSDKILYAMRDERFLLGSRNLDSGYIEIEKEESVNETV
jgi:hypothetical protein